MSTPEARRRLVTRLLLCLATAIAVCATAYVCAWYEYRGVYVYGLNPGLEGEAFERAQPTLWQFTLDPRSRGMQWTCVLAGALTIPLCLLYTEWPLRTQPSLRETLMANAVTAVFCLLAALTMAALHVPWGH